MARSIASQARRMQARSARTGSRAGVGPSGLTSRQDWAYLMGGSYPTGYARPATEAEAMGLPPFGRGVELLCNAVAGTDWEAQRWNSTLGVSERWETQPNVLTRPTPWQTAWAYRWAAVADLILFGNTFAMCGPTDWATRRPGALIPVGADRVGLLWNPHLTGFSYVVDGVELEPYLGDPGDPAGSDLPLPDYSGQVFHISAGNRSGELFGVGVLNQYRGWLGGAVALEHHAGSYFAGGALPPAVLQSPQVLTQDQANDLKAKWRDMVSTREPVVLPAGYVLTPVVSNAEEAQLVQSRQWDATEVAMILGIPAYKLGLPGASMTYQNVESADIEFVRDSVDRYAAPLSEAFAAFLMPTGTDVAWEYARRMRADQKSTAEVLKTYTDAGILTLDEARASLNRPPLPPEPKPAPMPQLQAVPEPDDTAEPLEA